MTENEIAELLKTHTLTIARSEVTWTSQEARKLYQQLEDIIRAELSPIINQNQINHLNQNQPNPDWLAKIAQEQPGRLEPLRKAQAELKTNYTDPLKTIHLIARPICAST